MMGPTGHEDSPGPRLADLCPPRITEGWGSRSHGIPTNLDICAKAYGRATIQEALAPMDSAFRALEEASRRPRCRLPVNYEKDEAPKIRIGEIIGASMSLKLRTISFLRSKESDRALLDIFTNLRIAEHLKNEPAIIPAMARTAVLALTLHPIWEGLHAHQWTDGHLQSIESELEQIDLLQSTRHAFEGERLQQINLLSKTLESSTHPDGSRSYPSISKKGWLYLNLLEMDRSMVELTLDRLDPAHHQVRPSTEFFKWQQRTKNRPDFLLAGLIPPTLEKGIVDAARTQVGLDQARIACALERYLRSRGHYPNSLEELSPAYMKKIPNDVMGGESLRYIAGERSFLLYSVGWDLKDDGGSIDFEEKTSSGEIVHRGDWIWAPMQPNSKH